MQYHFVVYFDTDKDRWFVLSDSTDLLPDGSVYDQGRIADKGYGWHEPMAGTPEYDTDLGLYMSLISKLEAGIGEVE